MRPYRRIADDVPLGVPTDRQVLGSVKTLDLLRGLDGDRAFGCLNDLTDLKISNQNPLVRSGEYGRCAGRASESSSGRTPRSELGQTKHD